MQVLSVFQRQTPIVKHAGRRRGGIFGVASRGVVRRLPACPRRHFFTGNKPKLDAFNLSKMQQVLLRVKAPSLCLWLIFGFGEEERRGAQRERAGRETVPSHASAAGASARNDERRRRAPDAQAKGARL